MDYYDSDGVLIAYDYIEAQGSLNGVVVLIHGFASNSFVNWVYPSWVTTLSQNNFSVLLLDVRGHGKSDSPHSPEDYYGDIICGDIIGLLTMLGLSSVHIMGYSMGARIAAGITTRIPERVSSVVFGGMGDKLLKENLLSESIAHAIEIEDPSELTDLTQKMFRIFAEKTKSDRLALAACIRGFQRPYTQGDISRIRCPTLLTVGTLDSVAGSVWELKKIIQHAEILEIPNKDHNSAVGDVHHKAGVLRFLKKYS